MRVEMGDSIRTPAPEDLKERIRTIQNAGYLTSERENLLDLITACNVQLLMQLRDAPDAKLRAWQLHQALEYELKKAGR